MMEIWKDIKGFEGYYQVSNLGEIKSFKRKIPKILKPGTSRGYKSITLVKNKIRFLYTVHKLVLINFDKDPKPNEECNHKDHNKSNNNINNLKWVTSKDNMIYSYKSDKCEGLHYRPVVFINKKNEMTEYFYSVERAEKYYNGRVKNIWGRCNYNKKNNKHIGWLFFDEFQKHLNELQEFVLINNIT